MSDFPDTPETESDHESVGFENLRGISEDSKNTTKISREKVSESLRKSRTSDLDSALVVHGRLCSQMDKAVSELRSALNMAKNLESPKVTLPNNRNTTASLKKLLDSIQSCLREERRLDPKTLGDDPSIITKHDTMCSRMDVAAEELNRALALSILLDRKSGSGFNVEARLNRRLDTRGLQRTLFTACSQVTKASKMSRAKVGTHVQAVEDLIDNTPGFK